MGRQLSKIIIYIVVALLAVVGGAGYFILSEKAQRWACTEGLALLREKLNTTVEVDSVDVSLLRGKAALYGFRMDDQQGVRMLTVDTLSADVSLLALLERRLLVETVTLGGASAVLYKEQKDSAANYQFVVEALRKKQTPEDESAKHRNKLEIELKTARINDIALQWDVRSQRKRGGDTLDMNHLRLKNMQVVLKGSLTASGRLYDVTAYNLRAREAKSGIAMKADEIGMRAIKDRSLALLMKGARVTYRDIATGCAVLSAHQSGKVLGDGMQVTLQGLTFSNNHSKRKYNPKRGKFDAKHLDIAVDVTAMVRSLQKDSMVFSVTSIKGSDRHSGLIVKDMSAEVLWHNGLLTITDTRIRMPRSTVTLGEVNMRFGKDKETGKGTFALQQSAHLTAAVGLQDLAEPFSPALSHFTTPLYVNVDVSGDMDRLLLRDIRITSPKQRLRLTAQGDICDMAKKQNLVLHFTDIFLDARDGIKEQIVGHFAKKMNLKMMGQMATVGDVLFNGSLVIPYRKELINGTLRTKYGNVAMDFVLDSRTKRMRGTMSSSSIALGEIMNVNGLGPMAATATYDFSIAGRQKPVNPDEEVGKLPQGWLKANVSKVSFKKVEFKDIFVDMTSDGTTAEGAVGGTLKILDITARFSYTQTTKRQHWHVNPKVRLSKKTQAEKAAKAREKAEKKVAREQRREELKVQRRSLKDRFSRLFGKKDDQ